MYFFIGCFVVKGEYLKVILLIFTIVPIALQALLFSYIIFYIISTNIQNAIGEHDSFYCLLLLKAKKVKKLCFCNLEIKYLKV